MQTGTSAKRVILLLISLNVVTILTSVAIFSSGMFVAKANSLNQCNTSISTLSQFGTFKGKIVTTEHHRQAILTLTLTGNPPNITGGSFSAAPTSTAGNRNTEMTFTNGTIQDGGSLDASFKGKGTDGNNTSFTIQFFKMAVSRNGNKIDGAYIIDGGAYNLFAGTWSVIRT